MKSLRIAVVVDSDALRGAEVYARNLVRWLPSWCRCDLVVSEPVADHFRDTGDRLEVVPLHRHRSDASAVADALARSAPDVVLVNLVDPASNLACLTAAVATAPTVATLHLPGAEPSQPFPPVACAIAPSAAIAVQLTQQLAVPPWRVVRVRHGVELPLRPVAPRTGDARVRIGAVAELTEQKGLDLLVDAAGDLVRRGERVEVLIAGAGRAESALRRRAEGLPVRFLGLCRDVPAFLRTLDVFCLPSRREALSLALLEAVGHGLPCVTTAVGDVVEALDRAALIVAPDDRTALVNALRKLVHDPALRGHLGSRARARALREFDVRMMANRTLAVLAQATRRPAPTPG